MFLHLHTVCVCIHNYWKCDSGNLILVFGCFFNSPGQEINEKGGIGLIGTFSKGICLLLNKWFAEMANDDKCRTMQEKDHHLPGLFDRERLLENILKNSP